MQALDPDGVETWSVRARYRSLVELQPTRALAELDSALARSPNDATLLGAVAAAERSLGRWDDALRHSEAAYVLDPRNASRASAIAQAYLWTRRPAQARAPADRALALAPANPGFVQRRAMVALAEGDLAAARQVLASSIEANPAELAAYMANIWDLGWVLDDAGQRLALSLGPESFDDDHGSLSMARAQIYAWRGDSVNARIWADSAQYYIGLQLKDAPDDGQRYLVRAIALAKLGRVKEATESAEHGLALGRAKPDAGFQPFYEHMAARTALLVGDRNRALDLIEGIMKNPWFITPAWLKLDPDFAPLRNEPRFQALTKGG
jgi:Flp pilus assembly protein TadD